MKNIQHVTITTPSNTTFTYKVKETLLCVNPGLSIKTYKVLKTGASVVIHKIQEYNPYHITVVLIVTKPLRCVEDYTKPYNFITLCMNVNELPKVFKKINSTVKETKEETKDLGPNYIINSNLEHNGLALLGKKCKVLTFGNLGTLVEFEENIKGSSGDGTGKTGHCLLVAPETLKRIRE